MLARSAVVAAVAGSAAAFAPAGPVRAWRADASRNAEPARGFGTNASGKCLNHYGSAGTSLNPELVCIPNGILVNGSVPQEFPLVLRPKTFPRDQWEKTEEACSAVLLMLSVCA